MKKALFLLFFVLFLSFLTVDSVQASLCQDQDSRGIGLVPCGRVINNRITCHCELGHFFVMLERIYIFFLIPNDAINQKIPIVPVIAALMLVWAGFMYISGVFLSGGSGHVQAAHDIFKYVIWGLVIIYGAHVFISFFLKIIGASIAPTWPTI